MDKDYLLLKRASASRPSGQWSEDDFDVLADGATPAGLAPFPHCFQLESREGSAPTRRGERRAGTGPRRDGQGRVMTN
jgi:hypothetical protein